jgi:hypothetical protein
MHGIKAKPNGSICFPARKAHGRKANTNMNRAVPEHILSMCNVSMPDTVELRSMEGVYFLRVRRSLTPETSFEERYGAGATIYTQILLPTRSSAQDFATSPALAMPGFPGLQHLQSCTQICYPRPDDSAVLGSLNVLS